jgi:hypothetical protein
MRLIGSSAGRKEEATTPQDAGLFKRANRFERQNVPALWPMQQAQPPAHDNYRLFRGARRRVGLAIGFSKRKAVAPSA